MALTCEELIDQRRRVRDKQIELEIQLQDARANKSPNAPLPVRQQEDWIVKSLKERIAQFGLEIEDLDEKIEDLGCRD